MQGRWEQIEAKFQRVDEHFSELESLIGRLREECSGIVGAKTYTDSGEVTYYAMREPSVSPKVRIVAGEALHALRSILDHLVWHLVEINGSTPKDGVSGFPIYDTVEKYNTEKARKLDGSGKYVVGVVDRARPYKNGNTYLWILNKLDNIDKHRLLIALAVSSVIDGLSSYERVGIALKRAEAGLPIPANLIEPELIVENPRAARLKAGDELVTVAAAHAHKNIGFYFDVAIYEPGVIDAVPFWLLFRLCQNEVRHIVDQFRLLLMA